MKFTDLTSAQRSMLTMLCTGQSFTTDELGRGCNPRFKPDQAASSLLGMRDKGLVFSNQKPAGETYAQWKASEFGKAVFAGRPEEIVSLSASTPRRDTASNCPVVWVVYRHNTQAALQPPILDSFSTEELAIGYAEAKHKMYGGEYFIAKLVARVKPVTQPTFEIERV